MGDPLEIGLGSAKRRLVTRSLRGRNGPARRVLRQGLQVLDYQRHGFLYSVSNFQSGRGLHALPRRKRGGGVIRGFENRRMNQGLMENAESDVGDLKVVIVMAS